MKQPTSILCPNHTVMLQEIRTSLFTVQNNIPAYLTQESKHTTELQDSSEEVICPQKAGLTSVRSFVISLIFLGLNRDSPARLVNMSIMCAVHTAQLVLLLLQTS